MDMLTSTELMKELDVSERTLVRWKREGCPHIPTSSGYMWDLDKVKEWMVSSERTGGLGRPNSEEGSVDPKLKDMVTQARLRKEMALAAKHEFQLSLAKKEVIPAEEVKNERLARIAIVKAQLLSLPGKLAPRLMYRTSEKEVFDELNLAVREILEEFSK
jgi:phage terminase Nu1 subunit (DNA packaging protein)